MGERKTFLLRLDNEDLEELRRWAADEFRSLNGQIEFLLRQALVRSRRNSALNRPAGRRHDPTAGTPRQPGQDLLPGVKGGE